MKKYKLVLPDKISTSDKSLMQKMLTLMGIKEIKEGQRFTNYGLCFDESSIPRDWLVEIEENPVVLSVGEYRLNIKYPIPEKYDKVFTRCHDFNYLQIHEYYDSNRYDELVSVKIASNEILYIPDSWAEEIKEDPEFEKWFNSEIFSEGLDMKDKDDIRVEKWCGDTWQASQKNRDLLYKDLINLVVDHMGLFLSLSAVDHGSFEDALKKIGEQL